ncbi:MAG: 50S ribosomal protein L13 [Gammaproteobacteria bacterium]|nr:50S ribosomal protein L13 [Gammaproteobacteria bacterium]MBS02840.1 50S ribosomal protein L13 [Gammaproteobacteria bacterium]|tara:strand:+ start:1099 stop:1527 length:429 start_codon:yes stop_codon:yes gene_type:complete
MRTISAKKETVRHEWLLVDAEGQTLGRMASGIANRLRGKHKAEFTPHVDTGDYVVVINADKIHVTGNKVRDKMYYRHSGYPGGLKEASLGEMMQKSPEDVVRLAVKGMMPKNRLSRAMLSKLKIYTGGEHPHSAQQPRKVEV